MARDKALQLLLKASSKQIVNELFLAAFAARKAGPLTADVERIQEALEVSPAEATALDDAMRSLVREALLHSYSEEELAASFSSSFHAALKKLICNIVGHHLPAWRRQAIGSQLALPRLEQVDWRVDVKSASDMIGHMAVPTVLVELTVRDETGPQAAMQKVDFELSRESLTTVLDGLGKIRDQLNRISR
mmetsp:Transcript_2062/g.7480  ORF Transcript_2062/g.7480 Transcript_2062/m.7480 type:complete len:190 (+) Transcript_2062:56-625(+)